ncbi:hypothetical protein [Aquimarina sp. 2201CG5-10]|uniref:hypothetical protein n=1 Tax=Aquimarina callyspongiae TaxID=3098150 RepID=UPI002AB3C1C9|nr:hypothetical protein [Aquimarina sp. 2201CG5-10]MDY8137812.1 hypothetical protein [Aquimarina sp. 2201CG5-10]
MKKLSLIFVFSLILFSCSKEEATVGEEALVDSFALTYKGNLYTVQLDENGNVNTSSLDTEISEVINRGYTLEIPKEDMIYLFDSEDEMNVLISEKYPTSSDTNINRSSGTATCISYKHKNYDGISISGSNNFSYPNLKWQGFNDIISSAIITNYTSRAYLVQFYKHDYFSGSSHSVIIDPVVQSVITISNFRVIGLNDEVTSIRGILL